MEYPGAQAWSWTRSTTPASRAWPYTTKSPPPGLSAKCSKLVDASIPPPQALAHTSFLPSSAQLPPTNTPSEPQSQPAQASSHSQLILRACRLGITTWPFILGCRGHIQCRRCIQWETQGRSMLIQPLPLLPQGARLILRTISLFWGGMRMVWRLWKGLCLPKGSTLLSIFCPIFIHPLSYPSRTLHLFLVDLSLSLWPRLTAHKAAQAVESHPFHHIPGYLSSEPDRTASSINQYHSICWPHFRKESLSALLSGFRALYTLKHTTRQSLRSLNVWLQNWNWSTLTVGTLTQELTLILR